uniref:Glyco_hydro_92N domain-containing protein n=1 Tax=Macrostomum lignano TaxID=282301 RepID=A0A1I8FHC6_9PLAT
MQVIADNFNVYHVCAPGHQDNAGPVASDGVEEKEGLLTERQQFATYADGVPRNGGAHFNLAYFVGFGSGAGSNVLCRYALKPPGQTVSMCLPNVAGYIKAYNDRPDLGIQRDLAKQPGSGLRTLEVQARLAKDNGHTFGRHELPFAILAEPNSS